MTSRLKPLTTLPALAAFFSLPLAFCAISDDLVLEIEEKEPLLAETRSEQDDSLDVCIDILQDHGLNIEQLPEDMWVKIMTYLPMNSFKNVIPLNKVFHHCAMKHSTLEEVQTHPVYLPETLLQILAVNGIETCAQLIEFAHMFASSGARIVDPTLRALGVLIPLNVAAVVWLPGRFFPGFPIFYLTELGCVFLCIGRCSEMMSHCLALPLHAAKQLSESCKNATSARREFYLKDRQEEKVGCGSLYAAKCSEMMSHCLALPLRTAKQLSRICRCATSAQREFDLEEEKNN